MMSVSKDVLLRRTRSETAGDRRRQALLTTSYNLLTRLQNWEDQKSWNVFFEMYWRLIHSLAIRSGLTETEAQDVVQETILRVAKDIHKFKQDRKLGSFRGWLRNLTRWRIADQLRKRELADRGGTPADESDPLLEEIPDTAVSEADAMWDDEWQQNILDAALERVKRRIKEEHYQIFDLYVVKRWPVLKVTRRLGVSVSQVYVIKHRISALIKKEIRLIENRLY